MTHSGIWCAIDNLAEKLGKTRWPSTETLAKIVNTYGMSLRDFFNNYVPRCNGGNQQNKN